MYAHQWEILKCKSTMYAHITFVWTFYLVYPLGFSMVWKKSIPKKNPVKILIYGVRNRYKIIDNGNLAFFLPAYR